MEKREQFTFFYPLRVRWNECDAQGIVFNVNYILYFDLGIWEYNRALGYDLLDPPEFVTAHIEADYRGAAKFDDELEIGVRCRKLGRKSCVMAFAVFRGDELLTEGEAAYVAVKRGTTETTPLEPDYIERVMKFEKTPPANADSA